MNNLCLLCVTNRSFKYTKSLKKDNLPPAMKSESLMIEAISDHDKAELFNDNFATVVTDNEYEYFELLANHSFRNINLRV